MMSVDITKPGKETIDITLAGTERAEWDIERLGECRENVAIPGSQGGVQTLIRAYGSFDYAVLHIRAPQGSQAPECRSIIETAAIEVAVRAKKGEVIIAFLPPEVRAYYDMALLSKELISDLPDILSQWEKERLERAKSILMAIQQETSYFRLENPTAMADVLMSRIHFASTVEKRESIDEAVLYSWHGTYVPDGEARIAVHLETTRTGILEAMKRASIVFFPVIQQEISKLEAQLKPVMDELKEGGYSTREMKELSEKIHIIESQIASLHALCIVPEVKLSRNYKAEIASSIKSRCLRSPDSINPETHIPFQDCYINTSTWQPEDPDPSLFYTYQVHANILSGHRPIEVKEGTYRPPTITLDDTPNFKKLLTDAYHEEDWPLVLSYLGYTFYSRLPAQKVLFIFGVEGSSKGTTIRILDGLLGDAIAAIDLTRTIESEKFPYGDIRGKTLLVDREVRRMIRKGVKPSFSVFNELFGGDAGPMELKFHDSVPFRNEAKGIFVSNLPIFRIDDAPAMRRILAVVTKVPEPGRKVIKDLDRIILNSEKDKIARLLLQHLEALAKNNWEFPGDRGKEEYTRIVQNMADSVQYFLEERVMFLQDSILPVAEAYNAYTTMCEEIGIAPDPPFSFTAQFGKTFKKRRGGPKEARFYYFMDCTLIDQDGNPMSSHRPNPGDPVQKEQGKRNQKKLDTEVTGPNPPNNGPPENTKDGVQPWYISLRVQENQNKENNRCIEHVPNLDTKHESSETPLNTGSPETKDGVQPSKEVKNLPFENDDDFARVALNIKQQMEKHEWHGMIDPVHRKIYLIRERNEAVVHLQNDIMLRNGFSLNLQQTTDNEMVFDWTSNYNKEVPL